MEYPKKLHDLHNNYHLAPEKIEISYNMLSNYCKDISNQYGIKVGGVRKLILNVSNKTNYVLHYKNLLYYLSLGMKLVKIHRILSFKQSNWLKDILMLILKKENKVLMNLIKTCISC